MKPAKRFSLTTLPAVALLAAVVAGYQPQSPPAGSQNIPAEQKKPESAKPAAVTARPALTPPVLNQDSLRLATQVINVPVTVTDSVGRYVKGLERGHFEVYEDKVRQKIEFFSDIDAPISVGIVFDVSGSMKSRLGGAHQALRRFIDTSHAEDDFFVVTFSSNVKLIRDFTTDGNAVINALSLVEAKGSTALYDGAYMAVEKVRQGRHKRRAVIIISDGEDNNSRYSYGELRKLVKESDVQIYALGIGGDGMGQGVLDQITRTTGGRAFFPGGGMYLEDAVTQIAIELRHQYSIGYVSQDLHQDGRWRKLKVTVTPPRGLGKVMVRTRDGYFAPRSLEPAGNH